MAFAKKTGDFAVLSRTDLSVIALTYQYEIAVNGDEHIRITPGQVMPRQPKQLEGQTVHTRKDEAVTEASEEEDSESSAGSEQAVEGFESIEQVLLPSSHRDSTTSVLERDIAPAQRVMSEEISSSVSGLGPKLEQGRDNIAPGDDDSEGDWITPSNVASHRNHDLGLLPSDCTSTASITPSVAACMTGDFAVQNVLLGIGLELVSEGGKRISKVRSWVLRCHACFK